jgi:hypothetical protein
MGAVSINLINLLRNSYEVVNDLYTTVECAPFGASIAAQIRAHTRTKLNLDYPYQTFFFHAKLNSEIKSHL